MKYPYAEPYKIKIVEAIRPISRDERVKALEAAYFNTYRLKEKEVYLDFSDSRGHVAMSHGQWGGLMVGDEAYAGSVNFDHIAEQVQRLFGKKFVVPTHRGRGAEHLTLLILSDEGQKILGNTPTPTLLNLIRHYKREFEDLSIPQARDPYDPYPFKGDLDLARLEEQLQQDPSVAYVLYNTSSVFNGGQPFSLENFLKAAELAKEKGIPIVVDATALFSSAVIIKEQGKRKESVWEIVLQISKAADLVYLSAREDLTCHTGGLLMTDQVERYVDARSLVVVFEGLHIISCLIFSILC